MTNIKALTLHYLYSVRRNKGRLIDILIWPVFEIIMFGYLGLYLQGEMESIKKLTILLLGNLVYWHVLARTSTEVSAQFFDDLLSRNLQNIIAAPVTIRNIIISLGLGGIIKMVVSFGIMWLTVRIIYGFNLFQVPLDQTAIVLLSLILQGLSVGLFVSSLAFLLGSKAIVFTWVITGLLQPFSAVFYPRSILPIPLKLISYLVPTSYIFEYLRGTSPTGLGSLIAPILISIGYLSVSVISFVVFFRLSKKTGSLMRL